MSNKYNLKWNSHHAEAFGNFDVLRSRELFVDITLSCAGQTIKAHKLVLCTGSAFFEKLLQRDSSACPIIHFYGIDMMHLRLLVDFMYLGEVDVPSSDLEQFIALADSLEVKGLKGDRTNRSDSTGSFGRSEMPSGLSRPRMTSQFPFPSTKPLGAPIHASTSTHLAPVKRKLPIGMRSDSGSGTHDKLMEPISAVSPVPEKIPKTDTITSDHDSEVRIIIYLYIISKQWTCMSLLNHVFFFSSWLTD